MRTCTAFYSLLALAAPLQAAEANSHDSHSGAPTAIHSQALFGHDDAPPDFRNRATLTNEGLVMLARAGYNERFLADLVKSKPCKFDTSVEGLVFMARQGISERLVRAILARERADEAAREREMDEPFDITPAAHSAAHSKPVKLRQVKQNLLVPANPSEAIAPGAVIVEERGAFWAKPVSDRM